MAGWIDRPAFSHAATIAVMLLFVSGCGVTFDPGAAGRSLNLDEIGFKARAIRQVSGNVAVRVAALSAEVSLAAFGAPLAKDDVKSVWIEAEKNSDRHYLFLPVDVDLIHLRHSR